MSTLLTKLSVRNYRALAAIDIELQSVNVFFGPNGAGKSSILDVLWFLRGCAVQNVDETAAERDHGIGLLWDGAAENATIEMAISYGALRYELTLGFLSGRIDPLVGELLSSKATTLISRRTGSNKANFHHSAMGQAAEFTLRVPERISLPHYLDYNSKHVEAAELNSALLEVRKYDSRSMKLYPLRKHGSESGYHRWLSGWGENLWSVLRNAQGRRAIDDSYETILRFMTRSFPGFLDLVLEASGPGSVYGSIVEKGLRAPIRASGISDGHLQMLLLLTALFAEGRNRPSILLFDEPETSLHPWALAVLAEAIEEASLHWGKQILLATHSPVLLSQFDADRIHAVEQGEHGAKVRRLSDIAEVKDLLEHYGPGFIYMAEAVARQSVPAGD